MPDPFAGEQLSTGPKTVTTVESLARLINGHRVAVSICAAARLELADFLGAGPAPVHELAFHTNCEPSALYRLMRALASIGIFEETAERTFRHTDASLLLRKNSDPSLYGLACMTGLMHFYVWPEILYSLRTGKPAFDEVFGPGIFEYMKDHSQTREAFDRAMCGYTDVVARAVIEAYDFAPYRHIIDVGGGVGSFLAKIASRYPNIQGTVYDLDEVVVRSRDYIRNLELEDRIGVCPGSFLKAVPTGGDLYTLKTVLCDWQDDDAQRILKNIRKVIEADHRLLIVDAIIPPDNTPCFAKFSDLNMMLLTGGRERTEDEFRNLLAAADFEVTSVEQVHEWVGLVEAAPRA